MASTPPTAQLPPAPSAPHPQDSAPLSNASAATTTSAPAPSAAPAPAPTPASASAPAPAPAAPIDRLAEVSRILSAQPLNPFDVLSLRTDASVADVRKQHRLLSTKIHPDRFTDPDAISRAQRAFALITAAKNDLLNETKRAEYATAVLAARETVVTAQNRAECARRGYPLPPTADSAAVATVVAARLAQPGTLPFPVWPQHPQWDTWVKAALSRALEEADVLRQRAAHAAALDEVGAARERVKRKADAAAEAEREQQWELHRDERVAAWRRFSAATAIAPQHAGSGAGVGAGGVAIGGAGDEAGEWGLSTAPAPAPAPASAPASAPAPAPTAAAPSAVSSTGDSPAVTSSSAAAAAPAATTTATAAPAPGGVRRFFRPPAARGEKARAAGASTFSSAGGAGAGNGVTTRDIDEWG